VHSGTAPLEPVTPVTPVTLVTAEALASLQDLIVYQDARSLDNIDQQRLKRHMQKFTKGAQTLIVEGTLQQDRIKSLLKANNEAKP
jgi:flagellar motor component MotA